MLNWIFGRSKPHANSSVSELKSDPEQIADRKEELKKLSFLFNEYQKIAKQLVKEKGAISHRLEGCDLQEQERKSLLVRLNELNNLLNKDNGPRKIDRLGKAIAAKKIEVYGSSLAEINSNSQTQHSCLPQG